MKTITNILLIHIYNYRYYLIVLLTSGVRIATGNIEILVYRIYVGWSSPNIYNKIKREQVMLEKGKWMFSFSRKRRY